MVHSWGLRDYNVTMGSFDGKSFEYSRRAYNFMGPLNKDFVSIEKVFDEEEVHKKYVGGFEVITSHQLADVLLSLIPFFSTRTVEIVGRIRTRKKDWY
ncbi:MAG: hypothetical protein HOE90_14130 [Bacteriovoracaceae bacterium]|nr:hypothetical protein [Bacteriovoracaceae bacterium]